MSLPITLIAQADLLIEGQLRLYGQDSSDIITHVMVRLPDSTLAIASAPINPVPQPQELVLNPGFENYGSGYQETRMYKYNDRVFLSGLVRKTTGNISLNDVIAVLPEEFRPRKRVVAQGRQNGNAVRLTIYVDGRIIVQSPTDPFNFISLDNISFHRNEVLKIGDQHAGGFICYIPTIPRDLNNDGIVDQGLIATTTDISSGIGWGCPTMEIPGFQGTNYGTGFQNTIDIVNNCGATSAAMLCSDLVRAGYDDWFLPSRSALIAIDYTIGLRASVNIGSLSAADYWSSSEYDTDEAWGHQMGYPLTGFFRYPKSAHNRIRAVRVY